jgi:hypothetical protein
MMPFFLYDSFEGETDYEEQSSMAFGCEHGCPGSGRGVVKCPGPAAAWQDGQRAG